MRLKQIAIAVDQLGNTLLGGWADETLSARAYRNRFSSNGWRLLYSLINDVFFWTARLIFVVSGGVCLHPEPVSLDPVQVGLLRAV